MWAGLQSNNAEAPGALSQNSCEIRWLARNVLWLAQKNRQLTCNLSFESAPANLTFGPLLKFFPNCFLTAFNLVDTVPPKQKLFTWGPGLSGESSNGFIQPLESEKCLQIRWIRLGQYAGPCDQHYPTYAGAHLQVCGWLDCESANVVCDMNWIIRIRKIETKLFRLNKLISACSAWPFFDYVVWWATHAILYSFRLLRQWNISTWLPQSLWRPSVVNCYVGELGSLEVWFSKWLSFFFEENVDLDHSGSKSLVSWTDVTLHFTQLNSFFARLCCRQKPLESFRIIRCPVWWEWISSYFGKFSSWRWGTELN